MRMARASQAEIDQAMELQRFLEATCPSRAFGNPSFPHDPDEEDPEGEYFDSANREHLNRFHETVSRLSPSLMRVVFGFQVCVDNVCDLDVDYLELKEPMKSSPGLLEVLEEIVETFSFKHGPEGALLRKAAELIAKVSGKEAPSE